MAPAEFSVDRCVKNWKYLSSSSSDNERRPYPPNTLRHHGLCALS